MATPAHALPPWTAKAGVVFVIDNTNLWIGGMQADAMRRRLSARQDPRWRVNIGRMVEHIAGERAASLAAVLLFGSVPPAIDSVWNAFEGQGVHVDVTPRSQWTGREKQVDVKVSLALTTDALCLYMQAASDGERVQRDAVRASRSYVLVSGDVDHVPACRQVLSLGYSLDVWSWRHALAGEYATLAAEYPQRFALRALDDIASHIGFTTTRFNIGRHMIPRDRTIVVQRSAAIADRLQRVYGAINVPFYTLHLVAPGAGGGARGGDEASDGGDDVAIILHSASTDGCASFADDVRHALCNADDDAACRRDLHARVVAFPTWLQQQQQRNDDDTHGGGAPAALHDLQVLLSEASDEGDTDDGDDDDSDTDDSCSDEPDDWHTVGTAGRRAGIGAHRPPRRRCSWREFCSKGAACTYAHSRSEAALFMRANGKSPFGLRKVRLCDKPLCAYNARPSHCSYAHGADDLFCTICGAYAGHSVDECPRSEHGYERRVHTADTLRTLTAAHSRVWTHGE